ncbi:MAG TPA: DUF5682 family protein [Cytophagales bacterium]|nr:DUF5682 family protein [Cytophagales bacterium]
MISVFGIRHHGPGSARSLKLALEQLQPDIVLVEGPPEGEEVLSYVSYLDMKPPVALLAYVPDKPEEAVFYPFAVFSPEWQAILYSHKNQIPVRFMDLPLMHKFALDLGEKEKEKSGQIEPLEEPGNNPMDFMAQAAGYSDGEVWWEHMFEQRNKLENSFEAVAEVMKELREKLKRKETSITLLREAFMRKMIRQAEKEGHQKIAVICGAWHAPALTDMPTKKQDDELLKNLPKVKVASTWIPWTNNRLTFYSGYGAGVNSPGWYQHLWEQPEDLGIAWMAKVARVFRKKNMDTSVAHVIEAFRLAESLAAIRGLARPGLQELNEATQSVICFGDEIQLELIFKELIIGTDIGKVPEDAPQVPLQKDLERLQKRLRLAPKPFDQPYTLDLRQPNDLERSKLFHRLSILGIEWGHQEEVSGKGTFKEQWILLWEPELMIKVIEMGVWGNTIEEASTKYINHLSDQTNSISEVSKLLQKAIPSDLERSVEKLMHRIGELSSVSSDISQLMMAIPPLAYVSRYGNVRKTDLSLLISIVKGLVIRVSIGLPNACFSLNDEASEEMFERISEVNGSINLIQENELIEPWRNSLKELLQKPQIHGLISGRACRLLADAKEIDVDELSVKFNYALSTANEPSYSASWLEGFLKGSGMILLLDETLWNILYQWMGNLEDEVFVQLLPLLRRNFSTFPPAERRKLGEKAKSGGGSLVKAKKADDSKFDHVRAGRSLEVIGKLIGIEI